VPSDRRGRQAHPLGRETDAAAPSPVTVRSGRAPTRACRSWSSSGGSTWRPLDRRSFPSQCDSQHQRPLVPDETRTGQRGDDRRLTAILCRGWNLAQRADDGEDAALATTSDEDDMPLTNRGFKTGIPIWVKVPVVIAPRLGRGGYQHDALGQRQRRWSRPWRRRRPRLRWRNGDRRAPRWPRRPRVRRPNGDEGPQRTS